MKEMDFIIMNNGRKPIIQFTEFNFRYKSQQKPTLHDINLTIYEGEKVLITGASGSGKSTIVNCINGIVPFSFEGEITGSVKVNGKEAVIKRPADAIKNGIGFVTEDRKDSGIFALMTVRENITINILRLISKFHLISAKREQEILEQYSKSMNMKYANEIQRIMFLSGGNQQKFVLARALAAGCKILILCEPTRGIDVGAKAEIYQLLSGLSEEGYAILLLSSELPEIMSICYRTLVIFQGKITGNILRGEMDENLIMRCATGNEAYFSEGAAV